MLTQTFGAWDNLFIKDDNIREIENFLYIICFGIKFIWDVNLTTISMKIKF